MMKPKTLLISLLGMNNVKVFSLMLFFTNLHFLNDQNGKLSVLPIFTCKKFRIKKESKTCNFINSY